MDETTTTESLTTDAAISAANEEFERMLHYPSADPLDGEWDPSWYSTD